MDLERLNKSQIVLLTLLISFVTSIATGIVTVSLMEQAPQAITQTVNRVVERTIEKVAPSQAASAAVVVVPPPRVPVRESDILSQSISKLAPSIVRLFTPSVDASGKDMQLFVGLAIVSDENGVLLADAATPEGTLTALRSDGIEVPVSVIARPKDANLIRLQAASSSVGSSNRLEWRPAALWNKEAPIGTSVVAIAGRTAMHIAQGVITGTSESMKDTSPRIVETNIPAESFAAGSVLIDAEGHILAIATRESRSTAPGGFLASTHIMLQNKESEGGPAAP